MMIYKIILLKRERDKSWKSLNYRPADNRKQDRHRHLSYESFSFTAHRNRRRNAILDAGPRTGLADWELEGERL